ncbi:MAG: hypothetical protein J6U87_01575 [Clostridia bacterium]|nr:hypothetical protein [Clostridia bacterium]
MRNTNDLRIAVPALNPGIDRTMYFDAPLLRGEVNRAVRVTQHGGCKSGNAACVMARLGARVEYITFTGGALGSTYEGYYENEPLTLTRIETAAGVRLNVKLREQDGTFTECNQRGGPVTERELAEMTKALREAEFDCLYLAGSLPAGVPTDFYADCVRLAKQKGAYTVVDADGEVLKAALAAAPDLVKPNRTEFDALIEGGEGIAAKIAQFREKYPQTGLLLSLGQEGALLARQNEMLSAKALSAPVRGTVAAGDTFLSAFTVATLCESTGTEALQKATAAAAAKVALEGTALPSREQMQERISEVIVTEIQDK